MTQKDNETGPKSDASCADRSATPCSADHDPYAWFDGMVGNCYDYADKAVKAGRPVVGIMCEYTPRELLMAANCLPVCLCGGDPGTIPAAEEQLPVNLCPLIKSTFGYHMQKSNPFLEMADLLVAETTCDGKKKMYELMARDRDLYILHLPHSADSDEARSMWLGELRKFVVFLEDRYGRKITDEDLAAAIETMNRERGLRRELAGFMRQDDPPLSGRQLLDLKSLISGMPDTTAAFGQIVSMLKEGHRRRESGAAVRVLLTGVPTVHGAERVVDLIEDHGGLVVAAENCTGLKPILEDVVVTNDDLLRGIADKYYQIPCSVMTVNNRRMDVLRELAGEYRADCIIDLIWQACLTYDVESQLVKETSEGLGIPYLRIETDYSPSDSARIGVRLEALFETVQGRAFS